MSYWKDHWAYCDEHRVRWWVGSGLFSVPEGYTQENADKVGEHLISYEKVDSAQCSDPNATDWLKAQYKREADEETQSRIKRFKSFIQSHQQAAEHQEKIARMEKEVDRMESGESAWDIERAKHEFLMVKKKAFFDATGASGCSEAELDDFKYNPNDTPAAIAAAAAEAQAKEKARPDSIVCSGYINSDYRHPSQDT